jgi:1-acyl-sn-glycerol-3-phosphate acyltransferase
MKKIIWNLAGFIWAIWGLVIFSISLIIVFPLFFILFAIEKKSEVKALKLSKFWGTTLLYFLLMRPKFYGKEKYSKTGTYVLIANHRSQLDIPVSVAAAKFLFKYLSKDELTKVPILGYVIGRLYITVSRGSREDRARSMRKMEDSVRNGTSVCIYPEGTRNKGSQLLNDFYDGAFRLAIQTKTPVAVLTIIGSGEALPPDKSFYLMPGKIIGYLSDPVPTENLTIKDLELLKQKVREIMLENLKKHYPGNKYPKI